MMGDRVIITEYSNEHCGDANTEEIHGIATICGDYSTICGMPFVDEIISYRKTTYPLSCPQCISSLEDAKSYKIRNGKWY